MPNAAVSKVYFAGMRARREKDNKTSKIERLFAAAEFAGLFSKNDLTAIKLHFGESGCDTFINPVFAGTAVRLLRSCGARPFLTDTNTLYTGSRRNSVDHMETALRHGFSYATVNAPIIIADGLTSAAFQEVQIDKKHFKKVKIAEAVANANSMLVLSHFKGHVTAGFGGAIKNLAMGCAPARGKREQHAANFFVEADKCAACGQCIAHCPATAIAWQKNGDKKQAFIDKDKCIACGECMSVCTFEAVDMDWSTSLSGFTERLVEYAFGAASCFKGQIAYINFLMNITPDCDCAGWSDAPLVPDIGILASKDPVALDKACHDLVNAQIGFKNSHLSCNHGTGENKFKGSFSRTVGELQFNYAEEIGMGSTKYELIEI
ncbi:MAG: DUF362 domain-containing protein [Deltaproteobacteria bacterium]|jgi:uncharacterized Fe-S center protein|nr:DUF362 domain-containing protein [Deltaproteobacteria bacterium]